VCSRGVSPDEKTCDHGAPSMAIVEPASGTPYPYQRAPKIDYPGQMKGPLDEPESDTVQFQIIEGYF
jgi:hypothetical protein